MVLKIRDFKSSLEHVCLWQDFPQDIISVCCRNNSVCVWNWGLYLNPFTLMSDQDRISPYSINMVSRRQELGIKKNVNLEILS